MDGVSAEQMQARSQQWIHEFLPQAHPKAIAPNYADFKTGQPVEAL